MLAVDEGNVHIMKILFDEDKIEGRTGPNPIL
jgi:uncharacterized protein (DUF1786 family)